MCEQCTETNRVEHADPSRRSFLVAGATLAAAMIGGSAETQEVVDYCTARGIKADVEVIRPEQIGQAFDRIVNKDVRYRFVIDMTRRG